MYNSMVPAFSTASRFARENETPYAILLTTTPSSLDLDEGRFFHNTIMGMACNFDEKFYDWYFDKGLQWLKEYITDNSQNDIVYIKFSHTELGKDEAWLKTQVRAMNGDMAQVKREILLEWTYSTDNSLFNEEQLDEMAAYADNDYVAKILIKDRFMLYLTRHPSNMLKKNYVIGLDIAGGLGRDKTALTIIDPITYQIVGVLHGNTIGVSDLVDIVVEILTLYFPNAVIVPELNYTGEAFVEFMLKDHSRFEKNLFYTVQERRVERVVDTNNKIDFGRAKKNTTKREVRKYGIHTNVKTRNIMVTEILFNFLENNPEVFNNRDIFDELKMLERKKSGKIEHSEDGHDDILMSYLVAVYAMLYETRSMKRFLKNIYDDENILEMSKEERESRHRVKRNLGKYESIISDQGNSMGEIGGDLYKRGILDEKRSLRDDAVKERTGGTRRNNIGRMSDLFSNRNK